MPELTNIIENAVRTALSKQMPVLIDLFGLTSYIHSRDRDEYDNVYGEFAGVSTSDTPTTAKVLFTRSAWNPNDFRNMGMIEDPEYGFVKSSEVSVGDVIEVRRDDFGIYKFRVVHKELFGSTTDIIYRIRLANLAD